MPSPNPMGLFCPHCRGVRLTVVCTKKPCPGVRIRYRKCSACGHRFATKEVTITARPAKS